MNLKVVGTSIVIAFVVILGSVIFSEQENESVKNYRVQEEKINNIEWNNEITRILPKITDLDEKWILMWSDSSEEFIHGEPPVMIKKTVAGNEVLSTSYMYSYKNNETYQILIWKGKLVSNWIPKEVVENIFLQTDAKTEKIITGLNLIPKCVVAYYDYYGEENKMKNDLLFSECAKDDFRIRINLVEGEYNQESIEKVVFLSNLVTGKI